MPIYDKPLPRIKDEDLAMPPDTTELAPSLELLKHVREAKQGPSAVTRILQDPTLFSARSSSPKGDSRKHQKGREHRSHRTPMVAAMAIAEEERQASQLRSLLQATGDRLEHEMRRAEEATARADYAERQASELLRRALAAEQAHAKAKEEIIHMERETRNLQMQLEAAQREARRLRDDVEDSRHEMEQLQRSETKAHALAHRNELTVLEYQKQASGMQKIMDEYYKSGQDEGYNEGYELGYEDGRAAGISKGRKEGFREGVERGRYEERQNAIEAFDAFLVTDRGDSKTGRICRWAESVYMKDAETIGPGDSVSVVQVGCQ